MSPRQLTKVLSVLISIILPVFLYSDTNTVSSITIKGNTTVSSTRIILMLRTKPQSLFDEQLWKRDIQSLMDTGYFSSVKYEIKETEKGLDITLFVEENPQIEGIIFTGARIFKKAELEKNVEIKKGDYYSDALIEKATARLKQKYEEKGIYFTEISATTQPVAKGRVIVTFNIREGAGKSYVGAINFSGNNAFDSSMLRKKMKIKQRKMPFIRGTFKPEILDDDIKRLEEFYHNSGYPDCTIDKKVSIENKMVVIDIVIKEGEKFYFGKTEFSGTLIFDINKIKKLVEYREGDVYSQMKFDKTLSNIRRMYSDSGYIRPEIVPVPEMSDSRINFSITINPGNKVYVNEINISGNTITKDKVIRREMAIYPGDEFSGEKLRKSFNNLSDLQFFDEIEIKPEPTEDEKLVNIDVRVKDRERTGMFTFGAGYSSLEKGIGFIGLQQRNFDITDPPHFRGAGQNINLEATIGGVTRHFVFSFTEPYLFDRPISFGPDIFITDRSWDDYTEKHNGFDIRIGRRWENFSIGCKVMTDEIELSGIQIPEFQSQAGTNRVNSVTATFGFQNLDRRIMPKDGDRLQLSCEYAASFLGSDLEYLKATVENDYYKSFGKFVFHSKTYAGSVNRLGSTKEVPLYERFFGGGIGTVRGYKERELGPRSVDGKHYLGGKSIFAQNLELLYPLSGENEILWLVAFYDAGNVWENDFDFGDLKYGAGVGLRIKVPILPVPIQLDYGWAINPESYQSKGQFHIGFTMGF
ncbi:MAG: outer membrane protein assembly factor BamA [Candidatus Ratteibacteria bacterium]